MKLILAVFVVMAAASAAQAESFNCGFTEPWITIKYDTGTQQMKVINNQSKKVVEQADGVDLIITGQNLFELVKDGKALVEIEHTNQGTDGASDKIYPFSAKYKSMDLYGACVSSKLKAKN